MANKATWIGKDGEKELRVDIHVGDTVRIHYKLIEKEKSSGKTKREVKVETRDRIQVYEGIVIAIKGSLENTMFMVRRIAVGGIGMERIFPIVSPWIKKIEVKKLGLVRRAKLYYLRGKIGKEATRIAEVTPKN
ncbi:MAG: 50S ribosomal protein L19 [Patescibacteria group bacterium]